MRNLSNTNHDKSSTFINLFIYFNKGIPTSYRLFKQDKLITYDDKQKLIYIPVVDEKGQVSKKRIVYQLKGSYFEFIGIETGIQK